MRKYQHITTIMFARGKGPSTLNQRYSIGKENGAYHIVRYKRKRMPD